MQYIRHDKQFSLVQFSRKAAVVKLIYFFLFQNLKLISILVQQGKLKEDEIEGVLKFLFPTK